jgi:multidrug transporter EmrE-like cation transporter
MNSIPLILSVIAILLTSAGQLLLKLGADPGYWLSQVPALLRPYINTYSVSGYGLLFIVTILSIYILESMPLKFFFPLFISGNLVTITIFSRILLSESFTRYKVAGICMILAGIISFLA